MDKVKFYYNSRGSLKEGCTHWLELLWERDKIEEDSFKKIEAIAEKIAPKLNGLINSVYRQKESE